MAIFRHFLGWDAPALPLAADFLVNRYAHDDPDAREEMECLPPGLKGRRYLQRGEEPRNRG